MTSRWPARDAEAVALACLRASLVVLIYGSEHLIDARQLAGSEFLVVLGGAAVYALGGLAIAIRGTPGRGRRALQRLQPAIDVAFLSGLAFASGGAFSDVRKAFFVIPLAAAFSERPRTTAKWSLLAVLAFTLQAVAAGGHPSGAHNTWPRMALNQGLYLAWTGAAATMLAVALRRRSTQIEELAGSRQRLVTQAIASVERERTRLADALHDSPVQNLMAARHELRRAERSADPASFARLHDALDATIAQLREEIFNLHPHVLDHVGLGAALEQVAQRHARPGLRISVVAETELDGERRQVLFALGRELLTNAARHANAREIRLALHAHDGRLTLEVTDDGQGIPAGRMRQALLDGHVGLASVRERVAALRGELEIDTGPERGTAVRLTLPGLRTANGPEAHGSNAVRLRREMSDRVTYGDPLRVSTS